MKFSMNGKIAEIFTRTTDMIIASLLWTVMCIPVITIIPSSTALYYTAAKVIRYDAGTVFADFFRSFRSNLKQGIALNLWYLLLAAILVGIHSFWNSVGLGTSWGNAYFVFYLVILVLLAVVTFYLIPVISRFQVSLFSAFRLAVYFSFRNLATLIPMLITLAGGIAVLYITPVAGLIIPGFYAYLMTRSVEPVLRDYIVSNLDSEDHVGQWYMDGWNSPQKPSNTEN